MNSRMIRYIKTVSPEKIVTTSAGIAVTTTTNSTPIATSTPVNVPVVGPISPPSTIQNKYESNNNTTTLKTNVQYPAVLKGNSSNSNVKTTSGGGGGGASPPNPNLVPSGKVPPPVPPRGSISTRGKADSSSSSSVRGGDDLLHGMDRSLHPLTIMHDSNLLFTHNQRSTPSTFNVAKTPNKKFIQSFHDHDNLIVTRSITDETRTHRRNTEYVHYEAKIDEEIDEFVSVERINDSFVIKTSPYPFKPARENRKKIKKIVNDEPIDTSINFQLVDWKMSRKDKKHSETYAERMRRLNDERERSTVTINDDRTYAIDENRYSSTLNKIRATSCTLLGFYERLQIGKRLVERTSWLKSSKNVRDNDRNVSFLRDDSNLGTIRSCTFLGNVYPEWMKSKSLEKDSKKSNVKKIHAEDSNFKRESNKRASIVVDPKNRGIMKRNSSFLHGYGK